MKFGQLIEYNMRNISHEKPSRKCDRETIVPEPFPENWNWAYLSINSLKIYAVKLRAIEIHWK